MKSRAARASLALALNMCLAASAAAQTPSNDVPLPERLLAAIDVPLTLDTIERAGLTEAAALRVLGDGKRTRYERLRAASALPFFATATARAALERAAAADSDLELRVQAVTGLARGFGLADPLGVRAALDVALAQPDTPLYVRDHWAKERVALEARPAPGASR